MGISLGLGLGLGGAASAPSLLEQALALATPTNLWDFTDGTRLYSDRSAAPVTLAGIGNVVGVIKPLVGSIWCYAPSDTARGVRAAAGVTFNGSNNYYQLVGADSTTPTSISITTSMTIIRGFRRASAGIKSGGLCGSSGFAFEGLWYSDNKRYLQVAQPQLSGANADTDTGAFVYTSLRSASGQILRKNGIVVESNAGTTLANNLTYLGRNGSSDYVANGDVCAEAVFISELTGAALTAWEAYIASKSGAVLA